MADHIEAIKPAPVQAKGNVDTVSVACKLPNGLVLQCDALIEHKEPVMGGGIREVTQARRLPETYVVAGNAVDIEKIKVGDISHLIIGGFAITPGIPKEFWERWLVQHKDMDIVKGGHIFAYANDVDVRARASEYASLRSGMEPIDPHNPEKIARGIKPGTRDDAIPV